MKSKTTQIKANAQKGGLNAIIGGYLGNRKRRKGETEMSSKNKQMISID